MKETVANSVKPEVRQGHLPTLIVSFLHFDLSFMLWVLPGALGVYIAESLNLSAGEKGLVVAVPILSGALLRMPMGLLADHFGAKRVGLAMLGFLFLPLYLGWQAGDSLGAWLGIGLLLGTAGASFSVALPLASRWYPAERQGLVMGIAAAGNSGTVIANLAAPRLADLFGWHNVLGLAMLPLALVLAAFLLGAKDSPKTANQAANRLALSSLIKQKDLWFFCLLYGVTFGGYVGLSSFFPIFLRDQYQISKIDAGYLTALVAVAGSFSRPLGGYLADRIGGARILSWLLLGAGASYAAVATLPALGFLLVAAILTIACLGMGNGAVFQLVPRRFGSEIGIVTGIVGAFGGLGGFLLPNLLGNVKEFGGSFAPAFLLLAVCALSASVLVRSLVASRAGWLDAWAKDTAPLPAAVRVQMAPYLV